MQTVLFHVQTGRINVGAQNVDAVLHFLPANVEKDNGLIHPYGVNLISRLYLLPLFHKSLQLLIPCILQRIYDLVNALSFRLSVVQEIHILSGESFYFLQLLRIVGFPCIFLFHNASPLFLRHNCLRISTDRHLSASQLNAHPL